MMRWVCVVAVVLTFSAVVVGEEPKITPDLIYGRKDGMALTLDVVQPAKANGAGILWIQSGGWYSRWVEPAQIAKASQGFLDKGYTMFIVRHGSAPKYAIPDAVDDVRLAVRFVRHKARDFGVDPERLGVMGGSAGGHLALVLATTADEGNANAKDPVLKQTNRVACVAVLFPPTDISTWVDNPPEIIKKIPSLHPPLKFDAKLAPQLSPALKATEKAAPSLMIHGDKDELVPISHSQKMVEVLEKLKVPCKLVTVKGAAHGFSPKQNVEIIFPEMLKWYDTHLKARE